MPVRDINGKLIGVESVETPQGDNALGRKHTKPNVDDKKWSEYLSLEELEVFQQHFEEDTVEWDQAAIAIAEQQLQPRRAQQCHCRCQLRNKWKNALSAGCEGVKKYD